MMNWLYYLAEANAYLCVFYLAYCLFLTRETYYQLSRAYLLFSCVAAFALPVLQLGKLKPAEQVVTMISYSAVLDNARNTTSNVISHAATARPALTFQEYLWYLYFAGAVVLALTLIIKLVTLARLIRERESVVQNGHKVVYLSESDAAFSFLNYLFIGTNARGINTIIRHELVHIDQKHSLDIVFLELLKIISWFNPCIYLMQNSLKTVHEYIADEQTAAQETDALTYSSFLVNNAYGAGGSSLTHSFFNYNLLKKRIIMLNQKRSGNLARLKYLLPVPLCAALLCVSTLGFSKTYGWVDLAPANAITAAKVKAFEKKPAPTTAQTPPKPDISKVKFPPKVVKVDKLLILNGKMDDRPYGGVITYGTVNYIKANDADAIKKWGKKAKNGVIVISGKSARTMPPAPKVEQVRFPAPVVKTLAKPDIVQVKFAAEATTDNLDLFYKEISKAIKYPKVDKDNFITGKVFAMFMVDEDHKVNFIKVLRTPSNALGEEVIRVIKAAVNTGYFKPGQSYTLPLDFSIDMDDSSEAVHATQPAKEKAAELVYNPNAISIPTEGGLVLNMIAIRGYAKRY